MILMHLMMCNDVFVRLNPESHPASVNPFPHMKVDVVHGFSGQPRRRSSRAERSREREVFCFLWLAARYSVRLTFPSFFGQYEENRQQVGASGHTR